jgi:hypothetical protein
MRVAIRALIAFRLYFNPNRRFKYRQMAQCTTLP